MIHPIPKPRKLSLVQGEMYEIEINQSNNYDTDKQGNKVKSKVLEFVGETKVEYIFKSKHGFFDNYKKCIPEGELKIKPVRRKKA